VGPKARRRRAMSHVFVWAASLRILLVWTTEGGTRDRLALIAFRRPLNTEESTRRSRWGREGRTVSARCRGARRRETPSAVTVERWRRDARRPSSIVFDDVIGLAFQRGIGATRLAGGVCRSVGRTCDGHARSSRVRCDGYGGARAPSRSLLGLGIGVGKGWEVVLEYGIGGRTCGTKTSHFGYQTSEP